jgi:hypothetical protein
VRGGVFGYGWFGEGGIVYGSEISLLIQFVRKRERERERAREREAMCFHIVTIPPFSSFVSVFAKKHVVA